ncbi:hypothetical protein [Bacillus bombysepticus]|uniref:hypothetical protein n=1 Tax=Bacillus bombysepticus TaxID=658666 RepID=UPI00301A7A06
MVKKDAKKDKLNIDKSDELIKGLKGSEIEEELFKGVNGSQPNKGVPLESLDNELQSKVGKEDALKVGEKSIEQSVLPEIREKITSSHEEIDVKNEQSAKFRADVQEDLNEEGQRNIGIDVLESNFDIEKKIILENIMSHSIYNKDNGLEMKLKDLVPEKYIHIFEDKKTKHVSAILTDGAVELIENTIGVKEVIKELVIVEKVGRQEIKLISGKDYLVTNEHMVYGFKVEVVFDDGSKSVGYGEANVENCFGRVSSKYMLNMAEKRAKHRAILGSKRVGLLEVYSSAEAEEFKESNFLRNEMKRLHKEKSEILQKLRNCERELNSYKKRTSQAEASIKSYEVVYPEAVESKRKAGIFAEKLVKLSLENGWSADIEEKLESWEKEIYGVFKDRYKK